MNNGSSMSSIEDFQCASVDDAISGALTLFFLAGAVKPLQRKHVGRPCPPPHAPSGLVRGVQFFNLYIMSCRHSTANVLE